MTNPVDRLIAAAHLDVAAALWRLADTAAAAAEAHATGEPHSPEHLQTAIDRVRDREALLAAARRGRNRAAACA